MEDTYLYHLASLVLPKDVLKYFSVVKIEPSPSLLRIHLDEKMEKELSDDLHFESKGFMDAVASLYSEAHNFISLYSPPLKA